MDAAVAAARGDEGRRGASDFEGRMEEAASSSSRDIAAARFFFGCRGDMMCVEFVLDFG